MALGKVQVNNLNLMQGPITEIERYFLFIGQGSGTNNGKLITVNMASDLDTVLGETDSVLKTQLAAARSNAGQNWSAAVYVLDGVITWSEAVDYAMEQLSAEAIVITDPVAAAADLESMQAKAENIMAQYMRPLFFIAATRAMDAATEDWPTYVADIKTLTNGIAADQVMIVPTLWGHDQGTLAGRLCNRAVTVADSPMRVATGPLVGVWSDKPADKNVKEIDMSILEDLDRERFSVPQWYPDYDGMYWGDGNLLDVDGGDYQVVENLRVIQKAMRRIYPLAVARVADRRLNSTAASMESSRLYFMRPLFEMSHSTQINGRVFPGEIKPPGDGDLVISWPSKYAVEIYLTATPYNSPKSITANLMLDLSN